MATTESEDAESNYGQVVFGVRTADDLDEFRQALTDGFTEVGYPVVISVEFANVDAYKEQFPGDEEAIDQLFSQEEDEE